MVSATSSHAKSAGEGERATARAAGARGAGLSNALCAARPSFWIEMYWFVCVGLAGWCLALLILPPKATRLFNSLRAESKYQQRIDRLVREEIQYRQAVTALDEDQFFRREVLHAVLKVYEHGEVDVPGSAGAK